MMKSAIYLIAFLAAACSCVNSVDRETGKKEVFEAEKAFERMAAEKGIAEAFGYFADEYAVIKRGNDSIISGKAAIQHYYERASLKNATVKWTPDYVDVSDDGTMAWTYGNFVWQVIKENSVTVVSRGVFHTVWKKQKDGSWRYVWD